MPLPLYLQGKRLSYPMDRRLGGPQSQSGHGGEEKNSQPLLGLEPLIIQSIAHHYTTELSQLVTLRPSAKTLKLSCTHIWLQKKHLLQKENSHYFAARIMI
jgi:hypothetical protein